MQFDITSDLYLRVLNSEDADILFTLINQNRAYLRRWLPWLDRNTDPEHSLLFIESIRQQNADGLGFVCGVFFDQRLIGICGYHEINRKNQSVTIGYWIAEDWQGRGIITRCTRFLTQYAFEKLKLETVLIPVTEGNTKSRAVCERLGYVAEGTEERAENLYGTWVDHVRYVMSRNRWFAKQVSEES